MGVVIGRVGGIQPWTCYLVRRWTVLIQAPYGVRLSGYLRIMKSRNERVEGITESYTDRVELGMRCWFDQVIEGFNRAVLIIVL